MLSWKQKEELKEIDKEFKQKEEDLEKEKEKRVGEKVRGIEQKMATLLSMESRSKLLKGKIDLVEKVFQKAIDELCKLPDGEYKEVLVALMRALEDPDDYVRRNSIWAIGQLGKEAKEALPVLTRALEDPAIGVRVQAEVAKARVLGKTAEIVPRLRTQCRKKRGAHRHALILALGGLGPEAAAAVDALAECLGDPDPGIRAEAAWALGEIGPSARTVLPALRAASADEDVRRAATRALRKIERGKGTD